MGELKVLYKGKWICYLINTDAEDHIIDECVQLILRDYPKDAEIDWKEWQKVNKELFNLLGEYCGKSADEVMKDATRDFWLNAKEAKAYGIIDEIIGKS